MATDYAGMEREFLASLEADTGHDLAGWMALIDAQQLAHRNDIIDWLRTQGFLFSWASWLERIHHNGGRPIYGTEPPRPPSPAPVAPPLAAPVAHPPPPAAAVARPVAKPAPATPLPDEDPAALLPLLAKAKAYRPLAEHVIREVRRAIPGVSVLARGSNAAFARPEVFAALAIGPRELRLAVDVGGSAAPQPFVSGRLPGIDGRLDRLVVLTDARQVDAALLAALVQADLRVNRG